MQKKALNYIHYPFRMFIIKNFSKISIEENILNLANQSGSNQETETTQQCEGKSLKNYKKLMGISEGLVSEK